VEQMTGLRDSWSRVPVEFTASQELLWLGHVDSSGTQTRGTSTVGSRYKKTGEETADREDSVHGLENYRV
jgi:hypothetical protein